MKRQTRASAGNKPGRPGDFAGVKENSD
jgi:hypothetical protein